MVCGGNYDDLYVKCYFIFNILYMLFNNIFDNIFKEFIKISYIGYEKVEGICFD